MKSDFLSYWKMTTVATWTAVLNGSLLADDQTATDTNSAAPLFNSAIILPLILVCFCQVNSALNFFNPL